MEMWSAHLSSITIHNYKTFSLSRDTVTAFHSKNAIVGDIYEGKFKNNLIHGKDVLNKAVEKVFGKNDLQIVSLDDILN